jgi:hypothetical protein
MKITGKHPEKINDPIINHPSMKNRRWKIDFANEPHTSFSKLIKKQIDEYLSELKYNDWDIGYDEFYEDLKENKLVGGVGDATAPSDVNPAELAMGVTVEMEHTTDPDIATEIALDHLSENPTYYTDLKHAGLANELDACNSSSGFGDPEHPINDKPRLGSTVTCTAGNNVVGNIGNTPDGSVEGKRGVPPIVNKSSVVDITVDDPVSLVAMVNEIITESLNLPEFPSFYIDSNNHSWPIKPNKKVGNAKYSGLTPELEDNLHRLCVLTVWNSKKPLMPNIEDAYFYIVSRNPELSNINIQVPNYRKQSTPMLDIVHGVISGIPPEDISFFVQDCKGSGLNTDNRLQNPNLHYIHKR